LKSEMNSLHGINHPVLDQLQHEDSE